MLTAVLSRADVSRNMQALRLLSELRDAFSAKVRSASVQTLRFDAPVPGGSTLVRQATLPGLPAYSVTVRAEWPDHELARSVLQLHDSSSGKLLAVMDANHLMGLRAALESALAADVLARPDAKRVAVLGSGTAASGAIKALRLVRTIDRVLLYEPDLAANTELALRLQTSLVASVRGVDTAAEAVAGADLVVLTGHVPLPTDALAPGAHVTVLAADRFTAPPLPAALLARARRVCDARQPEPAWGGPFHAELGEVLRGDAPGRRGPEDLTVFVSVGPAFLDLLAAWHVYESAREDEGLTRLDLEA